VDQYIHDHPDVSTFIVRSRTKFAQTPTWIARSGKNLSTGAKALHTAIMTYADNEKRSAFPSQETLAHDLGVSDRSVRTYMTELEKFGALIVERRRNKRTGNFYANQYELVFDDPRVTSDPPSEAGFLRPPEADFRRTTPTTSTTPTDSSLRSHQASPDDEKTSSLRSPHTACEADAAGSHQREQRHDKPLRDALIAFYVSSDPTRLEDAVEAYAATWNNSGDDMLANHWAEERTWDEIHTRVLKAKRAGKREPLSYAVGQLISEMNNMVA
jgi:hypothetical protein